jgi:murein L,D-transpeptidase YcbB/YkuD
MDVACEAAITWTMIRMLREIDCRRPAPRRGFAVPQRGLAVVWLSLPLLIGAAPSASAGDWSATARWIGESVLNLADTTGVGPVANPGSPVVGKDLPLPPYPPPVSGLDGRGDAKSVAGFAAEAGTAAEAAASKATPDEKTTPTKQAVSDEKAAPDRKSEPSTKSAGAMPDAAPAPALATDSPPAAKAAQLPAALPAAGAAPLSPPAPPAIAGEDHMPDVMRAAFAKAAAGALFPRLGKPERLALGTYYDKRAFKPLWHIDGVPTPAALALLDRLAHAAEEGLDPDDYAAAATPSASTRPEDVGDSEWRISAAALAYARDARGARINPARLSALITPQLALPDADTVLDTLIRASDAGTALEAFNPRAGGYVNLRTALATLRAEMIAPSPAKTEGAGDAQLASVGPDLVKGRNGSPLDQAAKRAVSALSPKRVEADIIANMERWRWLPPELGDRYILVNVPEFALRYVNNGALVHEARVIVGKPTSPTPIFSGEMKFLVVNPSWYIPPSILKKEFLPKLADDPLYAERQGYVVVRHAGQISIRQPPGARNALGRIKFMFPNDHSVYLHDTPSRGLFASAGRAFSHGCVRVDQPFKLAEYVLNDASIWPEKRIEKMIGGGERTINLPMQLPVHLAYFTLAADAEGKLRRFGDLYGLDSRLEGALAPRK